MTTQGEFRQIVLFNVFVLLIIICALVCCILISGQEKQQELIKKKIYILDKFAPDCDTDTKCKRFPRALIIGAKKCGTAALLDFINIHPMVRICHKEVHFFDNNETYVKGYNWYRDQMPSSFADQITLEKSPKYFVSKSAPVRIHEMNSSIKLILIVRDPVVRAISDYVHIQNSRQIRLPPFEQLAFEKGTGQVNATWRPIYIGMYAFHFVRWLEHFRRDQILVVSGENLISDPLSELERVEKFLGLQPLITADHFVFNKTKGFMCYKTFDKRKTECLHQAKGREHPQVDPHALQKLKNFYKPYNDEFYKIVGFNFGW